MSWAARSSIFFWRAASQRVEFIAVALRNIRGALCQFGLEAKPEVLFIVFVFCEQQAERLLGAQLGNSGKILHAEAIQHLSSL